ncbi:MAG TPA: LysM peptidoglycan-binding domain-containing protein [Campylobacterales bacterium]|nr:LysM peptidoglycan-binding domain-containing protein [Campylobacterales bacterium]
MGFFDFVSDAGKSLLGKGDDATSIKEEIEGSFENLPVDGLVVGVETPIVTLAGIAQDYPTREKVILIAGNVEGIAQVDAEQLVTLEQISEENVREIPEEIFYNIVKGDTLWAIATKFYDDGSKYTHIVDANLEVIKNADLIYPGQAIRIPEVLA